MLSAAGWQFKLKNGASGRAGRHPDPTIMALDDRLADRKTHSHRGLLLYVGFLTFVQWWLAAPEWGDKLIQSEQVRGTGS